MHPRCCARIARATRRDPGTGAAVSGRRDPDPRWAAAPSASTAAVDDRAPRRASTGCSPDHSRFPTGDRPCGLGSRRRAQHRSLGAAGGGRSRHLPARCRHAALPPPLTPNADGLPGAVRGPGRAGRCDLDPVGRALCLAALGAHRRRRDALCGRSPPLSLLTAARSPAPLCSRSSGPPVAVAGRPAPAQRWCHRACPGRRATALASGRTCMAST